MFNDNQMSLFNFDTPRMDKLDLSRCSARMISQHTAALMVEKYHYAHRVPSISYAIGLYVDDVLAGCITYGVPASSKTRPAVCGEKYQEYVYELNRLYCHEWVGRNSESWLIGQSFKLLPKPLILISMADTGQDHIGYIYQATNWIYVGLSDNTGNFSRIEINGKERMSKSFYDELGTQARAVIEKRYSNAIFHEYTRKHRYIYFLGRKSEIKEMKGALRWQVSSYPKGRNLTPREPDSLKAGASCLPDVVKSESILPA